MKIIETTVTVTGTRYLIAWSYRKISSEQELKNILAGKSQNDVSDVIQFINPTSLQPAVAFQVRDGLFQNFKESYRYTCDLTLYQNYQFKNNEQRLVAKQSTVLDKIKNWIAYYFTRSTG